MNYSLYNSFQFQGMQGRRRGRGRQRDDFQGPPPPSPKHHLSFPDFGTIYTALRQSTTFNFMIPVENAIPPPKYHLSSPESGTVNTNPLISPKHHLSFSDSCTNTLYRLILLMFTSCVTCMMYPIYQSTIIIRI